MAHSLHALELLPSSSLKTALLREGNDGEDDEDDEDDDDKEEPEDEDETSDGYSE